MERWIRFINPPKKIKNTSRKKTKRQQILEILRITRQQILELAVKQLKPKGRKDKMEGSGKQKKISEIKTFPVLHALGEIKENIVINTNTTQKFSKDELIKIIGNNKTEKVFNYFSNTPKD